MNKNAIKKFAIEARKKLIASVSDRAGMLGITSEGCSEPVSKGADFEIYKTVAGTEITLSKSQCEQRRKLKEQVETRGFEAVVEEVAYTWFNRICAIRFMEVNDYLPTRVRVLSSEKEGKNEPDIVTQAPDVDLDFTDKEREYILDCKMNNKLDDLFKMLFIKQCNKLSEILPELFEATEDYTEMLLNISYTNKDDIIYMLVNQETGIPEADFNVSTIGEDGQPTGQVEIIGWLYQYYNTELKDDTFAQLKKNVKISKERIPAATQLFTPDWIVRYMVENSVGRLWIEHLRAVDPTINEKEVAEKFGWKYYLPEAEQEVDVNVKLAEIRTSYKDLKPEDITCIDPCMGSGHILVAMFDVLMDIYKSAGYSERDAAFEIVEHNIHGLDIDKRAYQLAYFAVMMKGRGYNRRFFRKENGKLPYPNIHVIQESNDINRNQLKYFGEGLEATDRERALEQAIELLNSFFDAKEYGSILEINEYDWMLLERFVNGVGISEQINFDTLGIEETKSKMKSLIKIAYVLGMKYEVVITNPPYMGGNNAGPKLSEYIKCNYPDSKVDLCAVFIERCMKMLKKYGYQAMITQHAWMFITSYEMLRKKILSGSIVNMVHLGARAFEEIAGEVVQTTTFVFKNTKLDVYKGTYSRLVDEGSQREKEHSFLERNNDYYAVQDKYHSIPGNPISYWIPCEMYDVFENSDVMLGNTYRVSQGVSSADNERFLRLWHEVDLCNIKFGCTGAEESKESVEKWYPLNKGGEFRKWYGNRNFLINYQYNGEELKGYPKAYIRNADIYFKPFITWSKISSGAPAFRTFEEGFIFSDAGMSITCPSKDDLLYTIGFLNSKVCLEILKIFSPTMNFEAGQISKVPLLHDAENRNEIIQLVNENIKIAKEDWDSCENSWDFKRHPLLQKDRYIRELFEEWKCICTNRFNAIKKNEERINELFIEIYDLQDELTPDIEDKDVTVHKADLQREIRSLLSYAVGCMFGRYSLDCDGIVYAGGEWDESKYEIFISDEDNCIPITDEEYFEDDIVVRFCEWLKMVCGEDTLEENLNFIAKALNNKGNTSREVIRNYFLKDFYTDHLKIYQKRPIYWLFDSGKQNGFKALIYMHRYDVDTVGRVRTDYLHKTQKYVEVAMQSAQYILDNSASSSEKSKSTKAVAKYTKQLAEMKIYDEAIAHIANQRIEIDLDDGVKVNYAKFQGVEVVQEGKKALKVDLLAKIK